MKTFTYPTLALIAAVAVAIPAVTQAAPAAARPPNIVKVMVIAEENRTYPQIVGNRDAPYLNRLATTYGSARDMTANYPVACPSLAGYILMTSGSTGGICDDKAPKHHVLTQANIFAHLTWKTYAEHAPSACAHVNSGSSTSNRIPTVVVSPGTHHVSTTTALTHCSTLRTAEDLLRAF